MLGKIWNMEFCLVDQSNLDNAEVLQGLEKRASKTDCEDVLIAYFQTYKATLAFLGPASGLSTHGVQTHYTQPWLRIQRVIFQPSFRMKLGVSTVLKWYLGKVRWHQVVSGESHI